MNDKKILEQVNQASCKHLFRQLNFECENGVLTIKGCLKTFYHKQVVQTVLKEIPGVESINNQAKVL